MQHRNRYHQKQTYQDLESLKHFGNIEHTRLQLLYHLLLLLYAIIGLFCFVANLGCPLFIFVVETCVMLRQLPESFARCRLDLECLKFL